MRFLRNISLLTFLIFLCSGSSFSQEKVSKILNKADNDRLSFNLAPAVKGYHKVLKAEPSNVRALDGLIDIYLHDYQLFDSARFYLDKRIAGFKGDTTFSIYFYYAECLRLNEQHEEAIEYFEFYKKHGMKRQRPDDPAIIAINQNIEYCQNAKRNMNHDGLPYEVANMDFFINSIDPEYTPVFFEDRNILMYNARYQDFDDEALSLDNKYFENIYYFDLNESVASTYAEGDDQEEHMAVVSVGHHTDSIIVFNKNKIWKAFMSPDRLTDRVSLSSIFEDFYYVPHGILADDSKTIIFSAQLRPENNLDIYVTRLENGLWSQPKPISPLINTGFDEDAPYLSADGRKLYFSSKGHHSSGGYDLFYSELGEDGRWQSPVNMGYPMNSAGDDIYISFDKSGKNGYFSSNRTGGFGSMDIYSFGLLKKSVHGTVKDNNGNLLAGALVKLTDLESGLEWFYETDEAGQYEFYVDPFKKFNLIGTLDKHFEDQANIDSDTEEDFIVANLLLEKDPGISLYVLIKENGTSKPIDSCVVTLTDNMTDETEIYMTKETGDFFKALPGKKLQDRGSYNFKIEKEGYLAKTITLNLLFDKEGRYNVHEYMSIDLEKADVGADLTKLIDLLPIYFDVGKYKIRPDASVELDKVVKVMNDNPEMIIELGSHTDSRGSAKSNQYLSDRRAKASAKYIQERITNPERISGKGYGESKLVNNCTDDIKCTEAEHQENRRTEFIIIQMKNPTGNETPTPDPNP